MCGVEVLQTDGVLQMEMEESSNPPNEPLNGSDLAYPTKESKPRKVGVMAHL